MILRTLTQGSYVLDRRDPRHTGTACSSPRQRASDGKWEVEVRWENGFLSWMPEELLVLAPDYLVPLSPRALMAPDMLNRAR